jgi:hypothetical protein
LNTAIHDRLERQGNYTIELMHSDDIKKPGV